MAIMESLHLPDRPLTRADWEAWPEESGTRYEIIDGELVVSASPRPRHQDMLAALFIVVRSGVPDELRPYFSPLGVFLADDTVMEPDLVVVRPDQVGETGIDGAPVIAAEVLSPSTRVVDLTRKRDRLRRAGCPHYWILDPDEPSVIAWELLDGEYAEVGRAVGEESLVLERPFPVSLTPAALIRH